MTASKHTRRKLSKQEIKHSLRFLHQYCKRNGWEIVCEPYIAEEADSITKKIKLRSTRTPEMIFYLFLHELGHMHMKIKDRSYKRRYGIVLERRYTTDIYKITRVQEEMEAWDVGLRFAQVHDLKINNRKFQKIKAECLMTYLEWASSRRKKLPQKDLTNSNVNNTNVSSSS